MCIYSPMPHTLSYCALIGKCALIRSNTVVFTFTNQLQVLFCKKHFHAALKSCQCQNHNAGKQARKYMKRCHRMLVLTGMMSLLAEYD